MDNTILIAITFFVALVGVIFTSRIYSRERTLGNLANIIVLPAFVVLFLLAFAIYSQAGTPTNNSIFQLIGLLVSSMVIFTITRKTGNRGVLLTLSIVPAINFLVLVYLALTTWPIQKKS